jgi:hypothetical protein
MSVHCEGPAPGTCQRACSGVLLQVVHSTDAVADDVDDEELLSVFRAFATFGAGIGTVGSPPGKASLL